MLTCHCGDEVRIDTKNIRYLMGVREILAITTFLARATLDDVLDDQGRFDLVKARETGGIHALKNVQFHPNGAVNSVTLRDGNNSLELMGKHFDLWGAEYDPDREARRLLEMEQEDRLHEEAEARK